MSIDLNMGMLKTLIYLTHLRCIDCLCGAVGANVTTAQEVGFDS